MRRLLLCLPLALLLAPVAHAGTVTIDDATRTLSFQGEAAANDVDVFIFFNERTSRYQVDVRDFGPDVTSADPRCVTDSVGTLECELAYPPVQRILGGAGDDVLQTAGGFGLAGHVIDGQEGNDQLDGSSSPETLVGGPGNDELSSDGGPTTTRLPVGPGDVLVGGDGIDEVSYQQADGPSYALSLDGAANDGAPGEGDDIASDVENLRPATGRPSSLTGNEGPNGLFGFDGPDALSGGGGNDTLTGGAGNDVLDGGAGDDSLEGGSEDDRLTGGPGTDSFSGDFSGSFNQTVVGNDAIFARDGIAEPVSCGPGADTAQVDANDTLAADPANACETVDRPATAPPGGGGGTPPAAARVSVRSTALRARSNRVPVLIACPAGGPGCVGTVRLRTVSRVRVGSKRLVATLATGSYSIAAGKQRTLRLTVGRTGRSVLRRTRAVRVRVELRGPGAKSATATRTVTLRR